MRIVLAFAAVYLIWGSTYLAIRFAVESLPVLLYAGIRFVIAGGVLYVIARAREGPQPSRGEWRDAAIVGALMLLVGNGGVSIAEQTVPSGIAAVLVATVPLWMVLLNWWPGGVRPSWPVALAIAMGLAGLVLLIGPADLAGAGRVDPLGGIVLIVASLGWASGSLYSRRAGAESALLATAMQQLAGGALLLVAGLATGELGSMRPETFATRSLLALAYLILFGSLVGFTAYMWLLRHVSAPLASTYAYVNPVVAVFLGWLLASEPITERTLIATVVIVAAVAIITTQQARGAARERREREIGTAAK